MCGGHAVAEESIDGNARSVKGAADNLEMTDRDVGSFDEVSRSGHTNGFSGKYKDLAD